MKKGEISYLLRKFRLIYFTDWLRFYIQKYKNRKINREFKRENPDVKLPPDYLIYESFQLDYRKYYTGGIDAAQWLTTHFNKHVDLKKKRILDWGCGPGRIIRHLPDAIGNGCEYFGTDYNKKTIDWCTKNLEGIQFHHNSLAAHLPFNDNFMDVIYGISIFTHLSEQMHYDWYNELHRILKPGGIMFLTTQGDNFKVKLTEPELKKYNDNQLVIRGNVKEGHRTYSAFHPPAFMKKLFYDVEILEHIHTRQEKGKWLPQDIWMARKQA
jgi:SAM-dependent methyltransferase